jgi:hypothetical protein
MKKRASKTEQENRVKIVSGDFLIIDRKKRERKEKQRKRRRRERGSIPPSLQLSKVKKNREEKRKLAMTTVSQSAFLLLF